MSLIQYVGIVISAIVISMIFIIIKTKKSNINKKPNLFSLVALGLIISNWIVYLSTLYLTDSYIIIPGKIGNSIFIPIWLMVSIIGLLAAYKESKNNKSFSILVSGLAIINAIVGMILWGISKM